MARIYQAYQCDSCGVESTSKDEKVEKWSSVSVSPLVWKDSTSDTQYKEFDFCEDCMNKLVIPNGADVS
jgi:hypothetical protein